MKTATEYLKDAYGTSVPVGHDSNPVIEGLHHMIAIKAIQAAIDDHDEFVKRTLEDIKALRKQYDEIMENIDRLSGSDLMRL